MNKIEIKFYYSSWSDDCKTQLEIINKVLNDYPNISLVRLNIDDPGVESEIIDLGICYVPYIQLIVNDEVKLQRSGVISYLNLVNEIKKY